MSLWKQAYRVPAIVAGLYFLLRIPFLHREDLWFGTDVAVNYLQAARILHGEIPLYFWAQDYFGTLTQFILAAIFSLTGFSILAANIFNVLIWTAGVFACVAFVQRVLGVRQTMFAVAAMVVCVHRFF